jgi:hypothetical protein
MEITTLYISLLNYHIFVICKERILVLSIYAGVICTTEWTTATNFKIVFKWTQQNFWTILRSRGLTTWPTFFEALDLQTLWPREQVTEIRAAANWSLKYHECQVKWRWSSYLLLLHEEWFKLRWEHAVCNSTVLAYCVAEDGRPQSVSLHWALILST